MRTRDFRPKTPARREPPSPRGEARPEGGKPRPGGGERPFARGGDRRPDGAERKGRPPGNLFWLYGPHAVLAALANPRRAVRRLVTTPEAARAHADALDAARARRPLPAPEIVAKPDLDHSLPPGAVHQGIAALVEPLPAIALDAVAEEAMGREHAVVVVLDQVSDPHNVGAILRSAAAFGALAVVVPDRHSPEETGALAKAASGALERLPLVRVTNVVRALVALPAAGFWIAGLAGEAPSTLAGQRLAGRIALVLGAEGEGLRRLTREHCDYLVRLPMTKAVESLNVSNAAAVALYELVRERGLA